MLTKVRKKQLDTDLWIIVGVSLLVLVIYIVFGREIDNIAVDTEIPIVLRVLFMGGIFQFGIAGLHHCRGHCQKGTIFGSRPYP